MTDKKWPMPYKRGSVYFQYQVKDYERAKEFYSEIMGFEMTWDGGTEVGWGEFDLPAKGAKLGINLITKGEHRQGSGTLTLDVEDIESCKSYLEGKGVKTTEISDIPDMVSYFNMKDSEGNAIQIVADPRVKTK
ncbi:VOC family protein [Candidatus Thorarchaeota archaeon]|nr:MAG: VOC family protein [Candidatus Thorarchaeota archaeon]